MIIFQGAKSLILSSSLLHIYTFPDKVVHEAVSL